MAIKWKIILLGSILVSIQYTHQETIPESSETNKTTIASTAIVPETSPSSTATVVTTVLPTTVTTVLPTTVTTVLPTTVTTVLPTTVTTVQPTTVTTVQPTTVTAPNSQKEDGKTKPADPTTKTNDQTSLVTENATTVLQIDNSSPAPTPSAITNPLSSVSPTTTQDPTTLSTLVPEIVPETTSNTPSTNLTTEQSTEAVPETKVPTSKPTQIPTETSSISIDPVTSLTASIASLDLSSSTATTKQHTTLKPTTSVVDYKLNQMCQTLIEMMKTGHCSYDINRDDKRHVLTFTLDDAELRTSTMAPQPSTKRPRQPEEKNEDMNRDTLISIMASCGALVLILCCFAAYCTYHRRSYRKNQQHLTEELQTVENGYHDNPTLEVMEVQPEMQEKKMALNGEFNDSWIVPIDNLLKDDMPDEEDTHL